MTDVTTTGPDAAALTAAVPRTFEGYTVVSLFAPTLIAGLLVAFDNPVASIVTFGVWLTVAALWLQQLALLVRAGLLPRRWWAAGWLPRWTTHPAAIVAGGGLGLGLLWHGIDTARPAWLWSLPVAVTIANATVTAIVRSPDGSPPRLARRHTAVLVAAVAAPSVLATALTRSGEGLAPLAVTLAALVVQVGQVWWLDVVVTLERSRTTSMALVRTEERLRFAAELHDVQGSELQNVLTRADLARTLLRRGSEGDAARAAEIVDDIYAATADALRQTREIAHGYRAVELPAEVTGAADVLAAAGITLRVAGPLDAVPPAARRLVALLVREGTTNVLRHSGTSVVDLVVTQVGSEVRVTFEDPGPPRTSELGLTPGGGLASLAERAHAAGMRLEHGPVDDGWRLTLTLTGSDTP
ncbi:sensor histidine kinase [Sanguibacter sp. A247]|uniref:sensor histidine kinase n=1 Tax=unclassified Sanguibacter TaxID=2645534 RepID=UPI003FD738E4